MPAYKSSALSFPRAASLRFAETPFILSGVERRAGGGIFFVEEKILVLSIIIQ
jgi:hypothetical protein